MHGRRFTRYTFRPASTAIIAGVKTDDQSHAYNMCCPHAGSRLSLIWCRQTPTKTKAAMLQNVGTAFMLSLKEMYSGTLASYLRQATSLLVRTWKYPEVPGPKL
jgi:hypothetical protein